MYYAEHIAKIMVSPSSMATTPTSSSTPSSKDSTEGNNSTEELTSLPADPLNILIQAYQNVLMDHDVIAGSSTATVMTIDAKKQGNESGKVRCGINL